jgi:hypothetical protein
LNYTCLSLVDLKKQAKRQFKLKPTPFNLYPNQKAAMARLIAAFLRHK